MLKRNTANDGNDQIIKCSSLSQISSQNKLLYFLMYNKTDMNHSNVVKYFSYMKGTQQPNVLPLSFGKGTG